MRPLSVLDVSECLLQIADSGVQNDMTNMKLQKLLYYCQGTFLSLYNKKLFKEKILKWQYGPVVKEAYNHYRINGHGIITPKNNINIKETLNEDQLSVLEDVYNFFGQYSAIKLMNLTHNESPWLNTEINDEIELKEIKSFFDTIVLK
jgi:uncharacterized phage-associated protein